MAVKGLTSALKWIPNGLRHLGSDGVLRVVDSGTFQVTDYVRLSQTQILNFINLLPLGVRPDPAQFNNVDGTTVSAAQAQFPPPEIYASIQESYAKSKAAVGLGDTSKVAPKPEAVEVEKRDCSTEVCRYSSDCPSACIWCQQVTGGYGFCLGF
ncbi:uncharacterized protein ColSpa_12672 [Colletotrichum spaethianum]|uniref:Uncharacterized protein n=1 Tax=Colletotrichum spaethianum TaxID=700344 RepID=A0AA37PHL7_9PEZI|nr:uncharacterized protein ColSpa_12672 [Colletotrichum spaethianum]GKT52491.1 hypothetical protein ColSpa_12672 [Colletotrichum spaethianum]